MKFLLALVLTVLVVSTSAWADGVGPGRKMTADEASAYRNLRDTIRGSLPETLAGYKLAFGYDGEFDEGTVPAALKPGESFRIPFEATYTREEGLPPQAVQSAYMDKAKGTPEQQARLAALDARDAELTKARNSTRDSAEKDKIRAELKSVRAESNKLREEIMAAYQAWVASGGANEALQNLDQSLPAKELSIRVVVNADVSLNNKATPYAIEGFPLAFEQSEGCSGANDYCLTVFLGSFHTVNKISGYTFYELTGADPGLPTRGRGLVLTVSGPKDKPDAVRQLLRKTDLAKLKSLVP